MNNRLLQTVLSVGICLVAIVVVIWIRGGFDPVRQPPDAQQQVSASPGGQGMGLDPAGLRNNMPAMPDMRMLMGFTGETLPGVMQPPTEAVDSATTPDDAEIIGIEVDGHWRAYRVSEMETPLTHVINDVVGGIPVTVTYCDVNRYARVFTNSDSSDKPLDVGVGGQLDGQMLLHVDHRKFSQNSPDIPLQDFKFERMTWKEWKTAHPDTDICAKLDPPQVRPTQSNAPVVPNRAANPDSRRD